MKIRFNNISPELLSGINEVSELTGIEHSDDGICVCVSQSGEGISIRKNECGIALTYGKKNEFFLISIGRAIDQITNEIGESKTKKRNQNG